MDKVPPLVTSDLHLSAAEDREAREWVGEGKLNCLAEGKPETVALRSLTLLFFRMPFMFLQGDIVSSGEGGDTLEASGDTVDTSNLLGLRSFSATDVGGALRKLTRLEVKII